MDWVDIAQLLLEKIDHCMLEGIPIAECKLPDRWGTETVQRLIPRTRADLCTTTSSTIDDRTLFRLIHTFLIVHDLPS